MRQFESLSVVSNLVPVAVYAPSRISQKELPEIIANTNVFADIGRPVMPLWVAIDRCDKAVIFVGELSQDEIASLVGSGSSQACAPHDLPSKDATRPQGPMA